MTGKAKNRLSQVNENQLSCKSEGKTKGAFVDISVKVCTIDYHQAWEYSLTSQGVPDSELNIEKVGMCYFIT